ncbi:MAG: CehA/McbA family metallohydrolase [Anaerolineaceae bacterium]|nr:CehA/McbA family metallohydrolase [Anaerolineaceae bacterium]MDD4042955.1 CehA/McbA family metallohydrolase [Anaerolineaceae bacterium]MDD4578086.1 CehA/McbA family metallohydrolase [Anaerolineaceae bacterium]
MEELVIALHMHTRYSDGAGLHKDLAEAGLDAGVDALLVTDHNVLVQGMDGYHQRGKQRLLMLVGEELHDRTLPGGGNHMLVFGHKQELSRYASDPQKLIDQANATGALTFLAHPVEDSLPTFNEGDFSWHDWTIKGYTGIELWNQMSEFKTRSQSLPKAALHALFPKFMSQGPLERTLQLWDHLILTFKKPVVSVAGVDAHNLEYRYGPLRVRVYPYAQQFRSLRTHILTPSKLTGEINTDRTMILEALRQGHAFCAFDLPQPTKGFRFTCNTNDGTFLMGDRVLADAGLTFQARLPIRTHVRLLKDGVVVKEHHDREVLTHLTKEPGVYRVEVYIDYLNRHRGWIFSNPIYAV